MKKIIIGIMSQENIRKRIIAIANKATLKGLRPLKLLSCLILMRMDQLYLREIGLILCRVPSKQPKLRYRRMSTNKKIW